MEILLLAILLGLIPAAIAHSKGHSFFGFWIYGALLLIVALPHAIILKVDPVRLEAQKLSEGVHKKCSFCAEIIKAEALLCRFCGRELPVTQATDSELLRVAVNGNLELGRSCLDRGANINAQNANGATALFIAAVQNRANLLRLLLERGADSAIKNNTGRTPKQAAAEQGHQEIVSLL